MVNPNQYSLVLIFSAAAAAGLASFVFSIFAEFKKLRKSDLRIDGKLCSLPESSAFGLGVAALICLSAAQLIGNLYACSCRGLCSRENSGGGTVRKPTVPCFLLVVSWISFVAAIVLLSAATSMSRSQPFGSGWLDGECYLVKDGIYAGSAILALLALGSTLGSATIAIRRRQAEEDTGIDAQGDHTRTSILEEKR